MIGCALAERATVSLDLIQTNPLHNDWRKPSAVSRIRMPPAGANVSVRRLRIVLRSSLVPGSGNEVMGL